MKKTLICFFTLVLTLTAADYNFVGRFGVETGYNSNILKLSEQDLDLFESGRKPGKFELGSTDDLTAGIAGNIGIRHSCFFDHTQIGRVLYTSELYTVNSKKSRHTIGAEIRQFLSRDLDLQIGYRYTPYIYVARYKSEAENSREYRDYDYARNSYRAEANYDLNKNLAFSCGTEYAQNYYNKYFTEYDCENLTGSAGLSYKLWQKLCIGFDYAFTKSEARGKEVYSSLPAGSFQPKDGSYEENEYRLKMTYPLATAFRRLDLEAAGGWQDRFFQSNESGDIYHLGRHDRTASINLKCSTQLFKQLRVAAFYRYEERNTFSAYQEVKEAKNYKVYNLGAGISTEL